MKIGWIAPLLLMGCGPSGDGASNQEAGRSVRDDLLPTPAPPPEMASDGPDAAESVFTSLDTKGCRLVAQNIEEGGYARYDCPGQAGYRLELIESDLRQNIAIIRPDGGKDELSLSSEIGGGAFSTIGKTVEWRGRDPARSRTLTLRYAVNENPDPKVPPRSYLVVINLAPPACPVARVAPGPQQSEQARAVADQAELPPCIVV